MSRLISIANQKGGVGKTTSTVNLASALARSGKRTLVIDLDPQCNATGSLGHRPVEYHALVQNSPIRHSVLPSEPAGLDLLPGSRRFTDINSLAQSSESDSTRLASHLRNGTDRYDVVLIDCPPSLGPLTQTALGASDEVLMPIQCEYFAMEGLTQMIEVIRDIMHTQPNRLRFGGILLTMYDDELELTREVDAQVRDFFGEIVFSTVIPRDVAISEAPSHGQSVLDYAPRSRGARAYIELCMEVLEQ